MKRSIVATYLVAVATVCSWIPWKVPVPRNDPSDEFALALAPSSQLRDVGYGWVWSGPPSIERLSLGERPEDQNTSDTIARLKAKGDALEQGHQPSSKELDEAVESARLARKAKFARIHEYYRSNAFPNYWRIALTLGALTAICGAVIVLAGPKRSAL